MKHSLIFWMLINFSIFAFSQSKPIQEYTINGVIVDRQNQAVPFCNITLYKIPDSTAASVGISNDNGKFELKVKQGSYYVKISFLSFNPKVIGNIKIIDRDLDLGVIILEENTEMLNEVVVTEEKRQMELHFEKRVFNVGQDISNSGENAAEILTNVPSVSVNAEGEVSLRGSQNVRILIDGKPSALIGTKSATGLRLLQGNLIDKIEVITNPSARYDAAGEAGIINIILKKNKDKGINGTFTLNAGYPNNYGGSYSINYRRNKINLFSNYGINYKSVNGSGYSDQRYIGKDTSYFYTEKNKHTRNSLSNNFTLGLDYFLNENNIVSGSFVYENSIEKNNYQIEYTDFDQDYRWKQTTSRNNDETDVENNIEASVNYKKKFKEKGRELTTDFKWIQSTEPEKSKIKQVSTNIENSSIQRAGNTENEYNYLFQTDYIHPFNANGKFETGLKSSFRIIKSEYSFEQQDNESNWFSFPAFNNNFIYNEKILAVFFITENKFGKFSIQAGMRGEYSSVGTELKKTGTVNKRSLLDLFPSASLSYDIKQNIKFQLSYSYRINRPIFRDLLPINDFTDTRVLQMGNPNLKPEYIHSFETGILVNHERFTLLSTLYYRNKKGIIYRFETTDSTGIISLFPINLLKQDALGFEANISLNPNKWWVLNSNLNIYKSVTSGTYQDEKLYSSTYSWTNRTTSKITFLKRLDFQASFNYQAPYFTPQGKNLEEYSIDLGLSGKVFHGNGSLIVTVKDLLNTQKNRSVIDNNGYYSNNSFQWKSRQFMLTFVYRLNQNEEAYAKTAEDND